MKKKFGLILAILLCVVLALTLVACGNKTDTESDGLSGIDSSVVAEKSALIQSDIESWLADNASDKAVDLSDKLQADLRGESAYFLVMKDGKTQKVLKPSVTVNYDKGTENYSVTFIWTADADHMLKKVFTAKAGRVEYNGWAGSYKDGFYEDIPLDDMLNNDDKLKTLDKILDATYGMINKTVTDSVSGKFGVKGALGVGFGDSEYGIDVKGNIDLHPIFTVNENQEIVRNRNNTEFSVVANNGKTGKVFGGLYYKNGATDDACKLYIGYLDDNDEMQYVYLDYAILNQLFDMLDLEFREGKDPIIASSATTKPNKGLKLLFEKLKVSSTVADIVGQVAGDLISAYEGENDDGDKISVVDINLGNLMSTLNFYGGTINNTMKTLLKDVDYLKDLDLTTMHGIKGHIILTAVADKTNGNLIDFELAINVPKCTFYFCQDETKTHFDIPAFSVSLYAKDFLLSANETVQGVIPADIDRKAEYFSPTNVNIQGDVTVKDESTHLNSTFRYHLVTEINPFKPSEAKASFTIKQTQGDTFKEDKNTTFFKLTYDQKTMVLATGGTAYELGDGGEKAYILDIKNFSMNDILTWLGIWPDKGNYNGFNYDSQYGYFYVIEKGSLKDKPNYDGWAELLPSAKAFLDNELGRYLLDYYKNKKIKSVPAANGTVNAAETGLTDGSDQKDQETAAQEQQIMDLIKGYASKITGLINKIKDQNVVYNAEEKSFKFDVTAEQINGFVTDINGIVGKDFDLIAVINDALKTKIPAIITDPSVIDLEVNTTGHKNQLYLTFTYAGDVYEITIDTSDDQFAVYFKLVKANVAAQNGKTFTFDLVIDGEAGTITANYSKKTAAGVELENTEVVHKNFSVNWGAKNTSNLEMYTEQELAKAGAIFDPSGSADCIGTKLVGGLMKFLNTDVIYPVSKFLMRQLGNLL